jgi:hypothetical protein
MMIYNYTFFKIYQWFDILIWSILG